MKIKHTYLNTLSTATLLAMLTFGSGLAVASGTHNDDQHDGGKAPKIGKAGSAADVTREITVIMRDNYYEPEEINIKKGETVRFKVVNTGDFVHEFNIGTAAMHSKHQEEMRMMMEHGALEADKINRDMMKMDMGNGKTMDHDDPNSVLVEPGKSDEVIWTFSEKTNLEFACNIPGHYESGMLGKMQIK
ncbi:cupredoxin domain-containing protein [Sneathiella aquimaris]|uniref:cupredoxin domain-containing protein n=1 Tax=Sneathiella aquimaris TaxID=2599305 RepID=UPI00146ED86D|nr:cupredoxin domain-containing protein [Sneathiella aquimaris]